MYEAFTQSKADYDILSSEPGAAADGEDDL